ncbi:MAK10-like protein [Tanacetum coccineum]|uniref:MAK10-like protein n=1 Tax=Tanacetum coccineum TaxID=301880 RepID=A0ABQ5B7A5_9ASTR
MGSFQGLTSKSPSSWHRSLAPNLNLHDHVNPITRRTIDQAVGGKLRDKNNEESWALLEDLTLYDNESWNDPRDFAEPVKAISMPHDVSSASDRRLIELKNQVQHMMEAHLFQSKPVQMNKITSSCEICSGPHDTQYCLEDHDEVTNKLDTFLKAFNDQMTGLLPSDTVKNPKLNTPTSSARSHPAGDPQSSYNSFKPFNAIQTCFKSNTCDKKDQLQVNTLTVSENETPTLKEPKKPLEDEFADLHLNRTVLEVLAHVPMYDALLDKYIVGLELGENGSEYIQSIAPEKMKDPGLEDGTKSYPIGIVRNVEVRVGKLKLFEDFHVVDMEREPTCPLLLRIGFLATANAVIDYKKAKIAVGKGLTRSIFGVKELDFGDDNEPYWTTIGKRESYKLRTSKDGIGAQPPYYAKRDFLNNHLPGEWGISRDAEVNLFKDVLVFRKMVEFLGTIPINLKGNMWESKDLIENPINWNRPPKEGDGAWHIRIELIDPDGEKFDRAFQSIPTNRRLSLK